MDNIRLLIWAIFGLTAWMTYQAWVQDYGAKPEAAPSSTAAPGAQIPADADLPALGEMDAEIDAPSVAPAIDAPAPGLSAATAASIHVRTDVLDLTISAQGGTLVGAKLLKYPVAKDRPSELVQLLSQDPERTA